MTKDDEVDLFQVGDVLYRVGKYGIDKIVIMEVKHYPHCVYKDNNGHSYFNHSICKSCFKTKEEAEREVQRRKNIVEKRRRLKEYEISLNKILGIENHFIVK